MSESKVHRLRLRKSFTYNLGADLGRKYYHLGDESGDLIPEGYRVVSAFWTIDEDAPANVTFPKGDPMIYPNGRHVFYDFHVDALPAYVHLEAIVERSDEPDVFIDLGSQIEGV